MKPEPFDLRVAVGWHHITVGVPGDPQLCPIALAIKGALVDAARPMSQLLVDDETVKAWDTAVGLLGQARYEAALPPEARTFINIYDEANTYGVGSPLAFVLHFEPSPHRANHPIAHGDPAGWEPLLD